MTGLKDYTGDYFPQKKHGKGYKSEEEFHRDLFSYVNLNFALLGAVIRPENQNGWEGGETQEEDERQFYIREFPGTKEEAYDTVFRKRLEVTERHPKVREQLKGAEQYIRIRLMFTKYRGAAFRFLKLISLLRLKPVEQWILLLSMTVSYDENFEKIFADLQGGEGLKRPTLQTALYMYSMKTELEEEEISRILQRKSILFTCFMDVKDGPEGKPKLAAFSLNRRALSYFYGYRGLDQKTALYAKFYDCEEEPGELLIREDLYGRVQNALRTHLKEAGTGKHTVLHFIGPLGHGKRFMLRKAAKELGKSLIVADVERLVPAVGDDILWLSSLLVEEAYLNNAILCFWDAKEREENEESEVQNVFPRAITDLLNLLYERAGFFVWMSPEKSHYLLEHPFYIHCLEQPMLTVGERKLLWEAKAPGYPVAEGVCLPLCASKYILSAKQIGDALQTADFVRQERGGDRITALDLQEAVKQLSPNQLGRFATKLKAVYTWEDLVVSPKQKHQMELICDQMKYRSTVGEEWGFHKKTAYGRGICALFYGSPGTGKTMAVQVMANELGLDLYRVDLSQMVSKYIGETEKNISKLFKKARNINALLFFDEADSLFAKRSEVKDSHDKNANAETAHLLQKLEDYEGITILCTNFINNIDDAFKRRIKFMVNFSFPEAEVRLKLWNTILPKQVPLEEEIDFEFFAEKFELAGSNIKEILTNAAYIAAGQGTGLKNQHIVEAVKLNYAKYGKVLNDSDFGYLTT